MDRHARRDFAIIGIEDDALLEQAPNKLSHMVGRIGEPLVIIEHPGARGELCFRCLDVELRTWEITECARVVVVQMGDHYVLDFGCVHADHRKRLARLAYDGPVALAPFRAIETGVNDDRSVFVAYNPQIVVQWHG